MSANKLHQHVHQHVTNLFCKVGGVKNNQQSSCYLTSPTSTNLLPILSKEINKRVERDGGGEFGGSWRNGLVEIGGPAFLRRQLGKNRLVDRLVKEPTSTDQAPLSSKSLTPRAAGILARAAAAPCREPVPEPCATCGTIRPIMFQMRPGQQGGPWWLCSSCWGAA
jgi:hypothetical protein